MHVLAEVVWAGVCALVEILRQEKVVDHEHGPDCGHEDEDVNVQEELPNAYLAPPLCLQCVACLLQADISQPVKHEEAEEDLDKDVVLRIEGLLELRLAVGGGSVVTAINPVPAPLLPRV